MADDQDFDAVFDDDDEVNLFDPEAPGDGTVRREIEDAEEDGRDGGPAVGSSDAPELMDLEDPLRRKVAMVGDEMLDLDNSGLQITELTDADDDPEW